MGGEVAKGIKKKTTMWKEKGVNPLAVLAPAEFETTMRSGIPDFLSTPEGRKTATFGTSEVLKDITTGIHKKQEMLKEDLGLEEYGDLLPTIPGGSSSKEEDLLGLPPILGKATEGMEETLGETLGSMIKASGGGGTGGQDGEDSTTESPEDPDVEQTIGDELAMRRVRRRLRDRFGRRATRGGGAEMVGTGYKLGG